MRSEPITSRQNPRVKLAAQLRESRHRQRQRRMLIDGQRELARAIAAGVIVEEVYYCAEFCRAPEAAALLAELAGSTTHLWEVTPEVYERVGYGERSAGLVGVARTPQHALADLACAPERLVIVLEGLEKPGNVGAILRSADATGAAAVIVADGGTDLYNPNAIRASLGTIFTVPIVSTSATEALAWLRAAGRKIFAARVESAQYYTDAALAANAAIVLGSEAAGLTSLWQGSDIHSIKLPMLGAADSLNVSATASVLCYEALRQRNSN